MKIKFLKEYKFLRGFDNDVKLTTIRIFKDAIIDTVEDEVPDEDVQWLIDNGFAEKVEEQWPVCGDKYWYVDADGITMPTTWVRSSFDDCTAPIGNVFKTEELAQRFVDYLKAVETVRHDKGFMKISRKIDYNSYGYAIAKSYWNKSLVAEVKDSEVKAGEFYFDTAENARNSLEAHRSEWKTIFNYDWSKE